MPAAGGWVQQAFLIGAPGKEFEACAAYSVIDCNLNHLSRERNGAIKGQKSLSFCTHP